MPVGKRVLEILCETGVKGADICRVDGPLRRDGESDRCLKPGGEFQRSIAPVTLAKCNDLSAPDSGQDSGNDDANPREAMLEKKIVRPKVQAIAGKGHIVERNDDCLASEILLDRDDV